MDPIACLIHDNLYFLRQGRDLLSRLSDEQFVQRPAIKLSPVGSHLRHCLDFYASFLDGLDVGVLDYDARHRDARLETDRAYALAAIQTLIDRAAAHAGTLADGRLSVAMDRMGWETDETAWAESTVGRELQFLRSHTVHHYALIAAVLRLIGLEPDEDFGVAPATLSYRRSQAAQVAAPGSEQSRTS